MYENREQKLWREKDRSNITWVGKILRRSHLDELPQAINLLKGDLSFVGPRAEWVELAKIFEKEIKFYKYRYLVKPGLIGWAQINFPPSRTVDEAREKFEYDLYYIKNHSLLLDSEIIFKSLKLFVW
jgi:lipopolysaccharide/colanic/teichoic acid biosynthesis glycosyltransferase